MGRRIATRKPSEFIATHTVLLRGFVTNCRGSATLGFADARLVRHEEVKIYLRLIDGLRGENAFEVLPLVERWMFLAHRWDDRLVHECLEGLN